MRLKSEYKYFSDRNKLDQEKAFYFVGIGGSGMAPLAKILHQKGFRVRGTDRSESANTRDLANLGIEIHIGHTGDYIESDDAVIFSDGIWLDNSPEFEKAQALGCNLYRRLNILAWLFKDKKTIAIAGTHGKTTTTALTAIALQAAGVDPSILVGGKVPQLGGAVVYNDSEWAICEACEAYDAYQDLDPYIVILTNLEIDHLDFHESKENLFNSMKQFVSKIPSDGTLIYCESDPGAHEIAQGFHGNKIGYTSETLNAIAPNIDHLNLPGLHNQLNATAALLTTKLVHTDPDDYKKAVLAVKNFQGVGRRLEVHLEDPITVIDDYAHHPTAIRETIKALRERYPSQKITYVFQPHLYSSTEQMHTQFAQELSAADRVVITDIFHSREEPRPGISAKLIVDHVTKPCEYIPSRYLLPRYLKSISSPGDVVIGSGVGNIGEMGPLLAAEFKKPKATKVAVIYGGDSTEREVSFHSGKKVAEALRAKDYDVTMVDITETLFSKGDLSYFTGPNRPDVIFPAIHGKRSEDGSLQGLFELLHIPYAFSNVTTSAICFDKKLTNRILRDNQFNIPKSQSFQSKNIDNLSIDGPWVVKPNDQGSTLGVRFVYEKADLQEAVDFSFRFSREVLIEEKIEGIELTIPVLNNRALPVVECAPPSGFHGYVEKYKPGHANDIAPARIPKDLYEFAQKEAIRAHNLLGCRGCSRVDFILQDKKLYALEVNTIPGLTATSLVPTSAKAAGISMEDLCEEIVEEALRQGCQNELNDQLPKK